jgi:hypothetical protein
MHGLVLVLAAKLPYPAGLLLAAGVASLGCSVWSAVTAAINAEDARGWELALGGLLVTVILGLSGLLLVGLGAPAFK